MMYLVGYSENIKGYRLYNPKSQAVTIARDVVVMENIPSDSCKTSIMVINKQREEEELRCLDETKQTVEKDDETYVASGSSSDSEEKFDESLTTDEMEVISQKDNITLPVKRVRRKPNYYGYTNMCVEDVTGEQITLSDAMNGPEKVQWQSAMKEE